MQQSSFPATNIISQSCTLPPSHSISSKIVEHHSKSPCSVGMYVHIVDRLHTRPAVHFPCQNSLLSVATIVTLSSRQARTIIASRGPLRTPQRFLSKHSSLHKRVYGTSRHSVAGICICILQQLTTCGVDMDKQPLLISKPQSNYEICRLHPHQICHEMKLMSLWFQADQIGA